MPRRQTSLERFLLALVPLCLLVSCIGQPRIESPDKRNGPLISVTANPQEKFQQMEHFGVSAAWWAQEVGTWPRARREAILDLLFDPGKGIGLEVVRYNLGGGKGKASGIADPWRSAECPLLPDGSLDWSRDAAAMSMIDGAVERGANVILFSNSPPASMTVTGAPSGNGRKCNLKPEAVDDFASYLARCAAELSGRWPIVSLSPINEPQWNWSPGNGQEGCHYSPEEAAALLERTAQALEDEGLELALSMPESGAWSVHANKDYVAAISRAVEKEPRLNAALGSYAVHSYWSKRGDREGFLPLLSRLLPGKPLWITEWTEMRGEKDPGMQAALALADTLHDDLVHGNATSWQYWIAVSKYDYADGLIYANPESRTFSGTKKLWALGNWSRFVRPGAVRLSCHVEGGSLPLRASAFMNPDASLVFILVNDSKTETPPLHIGLEGFEPLPAPVRAFETSARRDLEEVPLAEPRRLRLPAESVTTLVFGRGSARGNLRAAIARRAEGS